MTQLADVFEKPISIAEAAAELAAIEAELARRHLLDFTKYTWRDYEENWHHKIVGEALDRVLAGTCRRLIILEPPQNGKSEQVSRRFPAYALGKKPDLRIIAVSYGDELAQDMSRDVQRIMSTPEYRVLFPNTRLAESKDPEKKTQGQFEVVGRKGSYVAVGIMGGITGKTSDIGIIDDPIKNRAEAESEAYRERVWEQFKSAFVTRQFGTTGAIVICVTRWHEDDLVGRLLKLASENPAADQWEVISLPALASDRIVLHKDDPRKPGSDTPLWPDKYPAEELARRRAGMGEYDWAALYQQQPAPSGGGLFKEEWFKFVDVAPAIARRARGWDTAGTENDGDWTVGVRIAEPPSPTNPHEGAGVFYIEDVKRAQLGPAGVDGLIRTTAETDGIDCAQREEKEGGSAGGAVVAARLKMLKGFDYKEVIISGSKVTRSKPFRAQCEGGNVYLVRGPWNAAYIKELCGFPTANHDDQVDATSCSFNSVLLEPIPVPKGLTW